MRDELERPTLLIFSHNRRNLELLTQVLVQANYQVVAINNYRELEPASKDLAEISLGLIDLAGCNNQIWHYCQGLQTAKIPFLIFTPRLNPIIERESLIHGASSVLVKPLVISNLLLLVASLIDRST